LAVAAGAEQLEVAELVAVFRVTAGTGRDGVQSRATQSLHWGTVASLLGTEDTDRAFVFFSGLGHMGMYIGGGNFIHAPRQGRRCQDLESERAVHGWSWIRAKRVL